MIKSSLAIKMDLYVAADKYLMKDLCQIVATMIYNLLDESNVFQVYGFALHYSIHSVIGECTKVNFPFLK